MTDALRSAGVAPLLEALRAAGGPEDNRPVEAVLDDYDRATEALARTLAQHDHAQRVGDLLADVERLRDAVLDGPEAIGALRERIASAKRALKIEQVRTVRPAHERVLARLGRGPLLHVPTSFATLDEATRGGLLSSRVHVIGGEPDSGKTALMMQMMLGAAVAGYAVAVHCVDEPGDGIEDRIGQAWGLALEDMEAGQEAAVLQLSTWLQDFPQLLLVDQEDDSFTIEESAEMILAHAKRLGCKGAVLGVDSIQTARCRGMVGRDAPRDAFGRVELLTGTLRALARKGLLIVATSELNRAFYKDKQGARGRAQPSEMGAFKGSGSIEYTMTTGMLVSRLKTGEHAGDHRVALPKNKRGEAGVAFRLTFNRDRCEFTDCGRFESEAEESTAPSAKPKAPTAVPADLLERVRHQLRAHPRGVAGGIEGLAELVGGKGPTTRRAIKQLEAFDEIVRHEGRLFLRDQPLPVAKGASEETAAELRGRVLRFFDAEGEAGRIVPSARAVLRGLRDGGQGARPGAVNDAVKVLLAAGSLVETPAGALALPALPTR